MSDESAKQLIASGRKRSLRMKGLNFPQAISDGCVMEDLAALAETALADLAKMTEERDALKNDTSGSRLISAFMRMEARAEAAESALARMKAQGTFAEGWKMVPVEPTFEMSAAAYNAVDANEEIEAIIGPLETITIYRAMLSASPPFLKEEPQS